MVDAAEVIQNPEILRSAVYDWQSETVTLAAPIVEPMLGSRRGRYSLLFSADDPAETVSFFVDLSGPGGARSVTIQGGTTFLLTKFDIPGLIEQQWLAFTPGLGVIVTLTEVYEIQTPPIQCALLTGNSED